MRAAAVSLEDLEQAGIVEENKKGRALKMEERAPVFSLLELDRIKAIRKNMNLYGGEIEIKIFGSPAKSEQIESDIWFLLKLADKAERADADRRANKADHEAQAAENE